MNVKSTGLMIKTIIMLNLAAINLKRQIKRTAWDENKRINPVFISNEFCLRSVLCIFNV